MRPWVGQPLGGGQAGQRPASIPGARTWWYHCQASGLMGSPTVPRMRRLAREYLAGHSSPKACSARIAVGAVYRMLTCAAPDQEGPSVLSCTLKRMSCCADISTHMHTTMSPGELLTGGGRAPASYARKAGSQRRGLHRVLLTINVPCTCPQCPTPGRRPGGWARPRTAPGSRRAAWDLRVMQTLRRRPVDGFAQPRNAM